MKRVLLFLLVLFTVSVGYSAVIKPVCKEKTKIEFKKSDLQFEKVAATKMNFIFTQKVFAKEKRDLLIDKPEQKDVGETNDIKADKNLSWCYRENINSPFIRILPYHKDTSPRLKV